MLFEETKDDFLLRSCTFSDCHSTGTGGLFIEDEGAWDRGRSDATERRHQSRDYRQCSQLDRRRRRALAYLRLPSLDIGPLFAVLLLLHLDQDVGHKIHNTRQAEHNDP